MRPVALKIISDMQPDHPKIGLAASRRMADAALDVLGDRMGDLPRRLLPPLPDEHTAVLVYEAMTAALREQERHSSARTRAKRSGESRSQHSQRD